MEEGLLRQRRNLIAISAFLLVFDFASVQIAKVSVLGTEFLVGKPRVVMWFIWVIWGYTLLRFYQYSRAAGDLGIAMEYRKYIATRLGMYISRKLEPEPRRRFSYRRMDWRTLQVTMVEYDPSSDSEMIRSAQNVRLLSTLWWYVCGVFYVVFRTTKFTDYVFPYLLAAAAALTSAYFAIDWEPERLAGIGSMLPGPFLGLNHMHIHGGR